ncbi:3-hydroxyacyl-CoA dehydrogenase [Pseudohoeflea suaedae]|uniref:3-hydroxyacyl-CoA dehydrogenase n=1 Tax=Pseudohoeflea suaedae TaxID=877384 RepID=A0A4R5PJ52_9HYPH|nr:3-hydroxyacyl-CoA dehydrogenase NAD-binding domain-containing protein [Pseudohoeflea suaedae]TDH35201.1 3-hydroxyacyl-CoA dehydrogenase [Pseudohoeflea suaedae]
MTLLSLRRDNEIAVVTLDNPPVNAISGEVRKGLVDLADQLDADPSVRAVVLICAGRTFIAGADVREFGKVPVPPHLPDVVDRIEAAKKPWVAAIHGTALGGGLEIAMGCRFRVAVGSARVGLPEVNLGIIPGASGTVRTPRLAGVETAVEMVTGGKPLSAAEALDAGLLDLVVGADLEAAAIAFVRQALTAELPQPVSARALEPVSEAFWQAARKTAAKAGHQAPLRALECIRFATENDFAASMAQERQTFLDLRGSDEAAALRYVFFAERAAPKPAAVKGTEPRAFATIGVVGGGTMGAGIAAACREAGMKIILIERNAEAVARGLENIDRIFAGGVKRGKLSEEGRADRMAGVRGSSDYGDLAAADLVIEAVFEDLAVKRSVFAELDRVCRPDAILATNTSYIDPRLIAEGLSNPDRFIGLHFFSPAHIMKLLEIVPAPDTAPDVLATGFALGRALKKIPVQAGICEGFIGNRILKRYRAEAEGLVTQGVPIAEVDAAMRDYGFKMGPFEAQDLGGLDIAFLQREGARAAGQIVAETLGDILVHAGRKGQKAGAGWYDYAEGDRTPLPSDKVAALLGSRISDNPSRPSSRADIARHLVGTMNAEGQAILSEGIATCAEDIDLVEIHGYGFPRWKGGPMFAFRATGDSAE